MGYRHRIVPRLPEEKAPEYHWPEPPEMKKAEMRERGQWKSALSRDTGRADRLLKKF